MSPIYGILDSSENYIAITGQIKADTLIQNEVITVNVIFVFRMRNICLPDNEIALFPLNIVIMDLPAQAQLASNQNQLKE